MPFAIRVVIPYFGNMQPTEHDVVVVGAGAAGLIAAWRAASQGASVLLLEKNARLGAKILISGGGKCNITHAGSIDDVLAGFPGRQARFLKPSLHHFPNAEVIDLIESNGLVTHVRDDGRVFPREGTAKDVVGILEHLLRVTGVEVREGEHVRGVVTRDGAVCGVRTTDEEYHGRTVILTTGGVSYPKTGTTGDGLQWAARLGHTIASLSPALAPIALLPALPASWRGVALRGGALLLIAGGRNIEQQDGDVLFSHEGVTGPAALELSNAAAREMAAGPVSVAYDFAPGLGQDELDAEFLAEIRENRGKTLENILDNRLPGRVVTAFLAAAKVDGATKGYVLTRGQRRAVVAVLKQWVLGTVAGVDITRGEVTAGGIVLDEVDPHTMRSRIVPGLFLAGEILDVAGRVGGYNLQAAFSTGYVAGESAAKQTGHESVAGAAAGRTQTSTTVEGSSPHA